MRAISRAFLQVPGARAGADWVHSLAALQLHRIGVLQVPGARPKHTCYIANFADPLVSLHRVVYKCAAGAWRAGWR
jgi:hypothetical protein